MLPSESSPVIRENPDALPVMRWGAIIGGWLVATGIASMLYVAGLAMGFSAFEPHNAEATAKGLGMGTAGWMILTWAVSLFLGGMFASWFDGRSDQTVERKGQRRQWAIKGRACKPVGEQRQPLRGKQRRRRT